MVNASGADVKVSLGECTWLVIDKVVASAGAHAVVPESPRIITTKSQVDDDVVLPELCVEITFTVAREDRSWGALDTEVKISLGILCSSDRFTQESVLI